MEVLKQAKTLKDTLRDLQKAKKPDVAKVAEAQRILTILREKLVAAAKPEVLGRYSRREAEVAKSRAESAVVQDAKADVKKRQEQLLANIAQNTEELRRLQKSAMELDNRGAVAFDQVAQAAQDAMEGVPDEPCPEEEELVIPEEVEEPPAKRPRPGASGSSGGDKRTALENKSIGELRKMAKELGIEIRSRSKKPFVDALLIRIAESEEGRAYWDWLKKMLAEATEKGTHSATARSSRGAGAEVAAGESESRGAAAPAQVDTATSAPRPGAAEGEKIDTATGG